MRFSVQPSISRAVALLGLLGMGLMQAGCAHPVMVEPSVSVHSTMGHFPVYGQVGVPGPVIYGPPRVIYAPPPPPRVIYAPPPPPRVIYAPSPYGAAFHAPPVYRSPPWGYRGRGDGHDGRQRPDHERGHGGDRDGWRR